MKRIIGFFILIMTFCGVGPFAKAQVTISVPEANIFNRTELEIINVPVLYSWTTKWGKNYYNEQVDPTFTSTSGLNFRQTTTGFTLPSSVLLWQFESIGGYLPNQGSIPALQNFNSSPKSWYITPSNGGKLNTGPVYFTFIIPAAQISSNAFQAGNYSMNILHNYPTDYFTPASFTTTIAVPAALKWLTTSLTKYIEIASLNDYRITGTKILGNLGATEIGNTVNFNFWAKSADNVQFTSSKGVKTTRNIASINLGSTGTGLSTKPLSTTFQNFSPSEFNVAVGNRIAFTPQLSLSAEDFKNYFFEAGTYTFQLNFNARNPNNSVNAFQNSDVQLKVLPLSEITIPGSGQNVNFIFNTAAQYRDGQSQIIPKQIKLSNNESFELYVKSDADYFKKNGVQSTVNSNILQIGVNGAPAPATLSRTPQKIISNSSPTLDRELDMKYTVTPAGAQRLMGQEKSTYSINVIYSFTAL